MWDSLTLWSNNISKEVQQYQGQLAQNSWRNTWCAPYGGPWIFQALDGPK